MASIQKRKDKYCVVYTYQDNEGKKRQKWETFTTFSEAKDRKIEVESDQKNGVFIPPHATTVSEFLELFVSLYGVKNWSMSSYNRNTKLIKNYINPMIGKIKLLDVTPLMIEKYYQQLSKTRQINSKHHKSKECVTTGTIKQIHKLLKCAFGVAVRWDLLAISPFNKVTTPKHVYKKRDIWTSETIVKALEVCEDPKIAIAIHLAFACSTRVGEILGLQWKNVHITDEDIENDDAHIVIEQVLETVSKVAISALESKDIYFIFPNYAGHESTKTSLVFKKPKTNTSIRKIWLPRTLAYILREWKKQQEEYKEFFGAEYKDFDLVICYEDGRPCTHNTIRTGFNYLINKNNLPKVVFHSLRHSSTTYKLKLNHGDIKATQGDTGHAQANMVTEVYGHILDEDRKINAQKFDDTFYTMQGNGVDRKKKKELNIDSLVDSLKNEPDLLNQLLSALKQ